MVLVVVMDVELVSVEVVDDEVLLVDVVVVSPWQKHVKIHSL